MLAHNGAIQLKLKGELARLVTPSREQEPTMADVEGGVGGKLPSSLAVGLTPITEELDWVANWFFRAGKGRRGKQQHHQDHDQQSSFLHATLLV